MKKIVALMLAVMLIASLVACGGDTAAQSEAASSKAVSNTSASDSVSSEAVSSAVESEVATMPENDYSKHSFNVIEYKNYYKLVGRYAEAMAYLDAKLEKGYSFDNTAQLLAFNTDCEGDVVLSVAIKPGKAAPQNNCYFSVYVDGVETRMKVDGIYGMESKQTLLVASGLKKGKHEFEIYRDTEFAHGTLTVLSVELNGVLLERPADKKLHIEFLGDSITAGYGNLTLRELMEDDASGPAKSDGTETYAFLAAKQLDADVTTVARSGLAFSYNSVEDYWKQVSYARSSLGEYKPTRKSDVVVINLGTNDHSNYEKQGLTIQQVQDRAVELIKLVKSTRPDAKIVWMYGMMGTTIETNIKAAIEECGGEASGIYYFRGENNNDGGGWHPSQKAHQKNGQLLADYIQQII